MLLAIALALLGASSRADNGAEDGLENRNAIAGGLGAAPVVDDAHVVKLALKGAAGARIPPQDAATAGGVTDSRKLNAFARRRVRIRRRSVVGHVPSGSDVPSSALSRAGFLDVASSGRAHRRLESSSS